MKVEILHSSEITPRIFEAWAELTSQFGEFGNPSFRPELFRILADDRTDLFIIVIKDGSEIHGILPYRREKFQVAKPVIMSDYQAVISKNPDDLDMMNILKLANLRAWDFDHLPSGNVSLQGARHLTQSSIKIIDLSDGFECYRLQMLSRGNSMKNLLNKLRLLERDLGEIKFSFSNNNTQTLEILLKWKAARFTKAGKFPDWVSNPIRKIFQKAQPEFSGVLSTLIAGNTLVAAHFGMRSRSTMHYWFPVYNSEYRKYSPGGLMLYFLSKISPEYGVAQIDLGAGNESYKDYFENNARIVY